MTIRDKLTILFTTEPKSGNRSKDIDEAILFLEYELIGFDEIAEYGTTILEQAAISERNKLRKELRNKLTEAGAPSKETTK